MMNVYRDPVDNWHVRTANGRCWEYSINGVVWEPSEFDWSEESSRWEDISRSYDTHTDADLAMALELAALLDDDYPFAFFAKEANYLRTEVRNALLERAS